MLHRLRRAFTTRPTASSLFDAVLFVAVPYFLAGAVVAAFHLQFVRELEANLASHIPVFFDLIALGVTIMGWPVVLVGSLVGVF